MLAANSIADGPQLCDGGLILCWSKIRKFITQPATEKIHTDRQRTENSITEATLIPCGLLEGAGQFRMIAWLLANS